ncbi:hypothetical protein PGB90_001385 [Kerria lacca]
MFLKYLFCVSFKQCRRQSESKSILIYYNFYHVLQNAWKRKDVVIVSVKLFLSSRPSYSYIIHFHLKCLIALKEKNFIEAYNNQLSVTQAFVKIFQNLKNDNWLIPVINAVCLDLRKLTYNVNFDTFSSVSKTGVIKPREALENTAEAIMAAFRVCAADNRSSENETKRWGMMLFANQLFKVYFKMSQLHLMKPLIRAIESSPFKNKFSIGQQVTYKYYAGLKAMMDEDYKSANQYLTFAFERCEKSSKKNKQHILIYLIPVRILLGYMPTKEILEKYELLPMWHIANAVKQGNVNELVKMMNEYQCLLYKFRIYTIVEKLRIVTYRNMFKKIFLLHRNHLIDMNVLKVGLQVFEDPESDLDETHCILANLIYEGKIKGYISLSHQKLVLSKIDPFPKLTSIS